MRKHCVHQSTHDRGHHFEEYTWRIFRWLPNAENSCARIAKDLYDVLESLSLWMEAAVKDEHEEMCNDFVLFHLASIGDELLWEFGTF